MESMEPPKMSGFGVPPLMSSITTPITQTPILVATGLPVVRETPLPPPGYGMPTGGHNHNHNSTSSSFSTNLATSLNASLASTAAAAAANIAAASMLPPPGVITLPPTPCKYSTTIVIFIILTYPFH